jgi:murein DD-endopeptidase MepM/ murein hydrolase activator NlpD
VLPDQSLQTVAAQSLPSGTSQPIFDFPWPSGEVRYWTGGPHGALTAQCPDRGKPECESLVPIEVRSGLDFALGGWEPRPMAKGTVIVSGFLGPGFGYGVVVDHGDGWQTWYAHMAATGLRDLGPVTRADSLGTTACTSDESGRDGGCGSGPHLHVELGRNGSAAATGEWIAYGTPETWDGKVIDCWTIVADRLNYRGHATRGAETRRADVNRPSPLNAFRAGDC